MPGPLKSENTLRLIGPIWAPVANIVEERPYGPGGAETRQGTKHFRPGAKVYVSTRLGHFKHMSFEVIGRHRATHRCVTMVIRGSWLTCWRVDLVHSPHVIEQIWWGSDGTKHLRRTTRTGSSALQTPMFDPQSETLSDSPLAQR
jgi:hypothetical protein